MTDFEDKEEELTNKERFLYVVCYIPFLNIGIFFLEMNRSQKLLKFLYQWVTLFWVYIVGSILLWIVSGALMALFTLVYFWLIAFLSSKAYEWKYVEISALNQIIDKIFSKK